MEANKKFSYTAKLDAAIGIGNRVVEIRKLVCDVTPRRCEES
jgi:hypothetical protein